MPERKKIPKQESLWAAGTEAETLPCGSPWEQPRLGSSHVTSGPQQGSGSGRLQGKLCSGPWRQKQGVRRPDPSWLRH